MATFDGVRSSRVSPRFLHGNSTSHTWPFSAVAELIDNAYDPDVNASELWIDKRSINAKDCLTFVDNGNGMNPDKLFKMLSFGYCEKEDIQSDYKPIGYYGNGFKSGSMRLGKDAMVFTRCMTSMSVGFLSQTYLEVTKADAVIVPIVTWNLPSKRRVISQASDNNLKAILQYSIFPSEKQLLAELDSLEKCRTGTNIIIYNLKKDKMGKYELDFESDPQDFRNPETHVVDLTTINRPIHTASPEYRRSLREYTSILFLKPRMKIILRGLKVRTKMISKSLSKTESDVYKPTWLKKPVKIVFGFSSNHEPESYGLMMYYKNRLIKAFEKVGVQKQANDLGVGVVGVVETDFLEPIHNKQDFNRTEKYSAFMQNVALKLNEYYNEKKHGKSTVPKQEVDQQQLPDWTWAQCDNCLKWRRLPTGYCDRLPDKWYCRNNPDAAFKNIIRVSNSRSKLLAKVISRRQYRCDIDEEPEDDDEALQVSYVKTYKKQQEEQKRRQKAEEERKILDRERELRHRQQMVEMQMREINRKNQELEVSSSQDRQRKPTVADLEKARKSLDVYQKKMKEQESTIHHLATQKQILENQKKQLLQMAESVKLTSSQNNLLVEKIAGTSSSTVTSSSGATKRKASNSDGAGGKMLIKTEDGETVEVMRLDDEEEGDTLIDLTIDDDDNEADETDNEAGKTDNEAGQTIDDDDNEAGKTIDDDDNEAGKTIDHDDNEAGKTIDDNTGETIDDDAGQTVDTDNGAVMDSSEPNDNQNNSEKDKQESSASRTKQTSENSNTEATCEIKQTKTNRNNSATDQVDIKPDKSALDKIIKESVNHTHRGSQTVPVVVKLASVEEAELLKLKPLEKNTMLLSKARELAEANENLKCLQENIYRLLKIIVPDYDYGEPEHVEKVILEFIRVNEEECQEQSQEASQSQETSQEAS